MMVFVQIYCSANSDHLSLTVDPSTQKGKDTVLWLVSQGNCPMCNSPLQTIHNPESLLSMPSTKVGDKQTATITPSISRYSGTKAVNIPNDLIASTLCGRRSSVSAHISQLLPVRAAVDILAEWILQSKSAMVQMSNFNDPSSTLAEIRFELIQLEDKHGQTKRGYRPSAGFPFHHDENMPQMWSKSKVRGAPRIKKAEDVRKSAARNSWSRFRITVFGGIRDDGGPFGALYDLGLAYITKEGDELMIGLTSAGAELANIPNPLIHTDDFPNVTKETLALRFSDEERQWFWNHANKYLEIEAKGIRQTLMMSRTEGFHVTEITEQLVKMIPHIRELKTTGTPPARRAYTSSLVNRWTGLGFLKRPSSGHYQSSELGLIVLNEYRANIKSSWQRSNE